MTNTKRNQPIKLLLYIQMVKIMKSFFFNQLFSALNLNEDRKKGNDMRTSIYTKLIPRDNDLPSNSINVILM